MIARTRETDSKSRMPAPHTALLLPVGLIPLGLLFFPDPTSEMAEGRVMGVARRRKDGDHQCAHTTTARLHFIS
jgi:hypothetical protein